MQRKSKSDTNEVHLAPKVSKVHEEKGAETEALTGNSFMPEV